MGVKGRGGSVHFWTTPGHEPRGGGGVREGGNEATDTELPDAPALRSLHRTRSGGCFKFAPTGISSVSWSGLKESGCSVRIALSARLSSPTVHRAHVQCFHSTRSEDSSALDPASATPIGALGSTGSGVHGLEGGGGGLSSKGFSGFVMEFWDSLFHQHFGYTQVEMSRGGAKVRSSDWRRCGYITPAVQPATPRDCPVKKKPALPHWSGLGLV